MSISYHYTDDGGIVMIGKGIIRASDVTSVNTEIYSEPEMVSALRYQIADFTGVERFDMSGDDVRMVAMQDAAAAKINPDMLIAVVAADDFAFGLLRMWEMNAESSNQKHSVFRTLDEADAWIAEMLASSDAD